MNVVDLDGNRQHWHLTGHISKGRIQDKSSLHLAARRLLTEIFPTLQVLEEVPIPLRKSETLYLDFFLPLNKKVVEVHGEQHYKFTPFYHSSMMAFIKSQKRDKDKQQWCVINGLQYIALPYNQNIEEWKATLYAAQNS